MGKDLCPPKLSSINANKMTIQFWQLLAATLSCKYVQKFEVRSQKNFCLFQVGFKIVRQTGSIQSHWTVRYSTTTQPKRQSTRRSEDFFEPKFRSSRYSRFYVMISASALVAKDSSEAVDRGRKKRELSGQATSVKGIWSHYKNMKSETCTWLWWRSGGLAFNASVRLAGDTTSRMQSFWPEFF